MWGHHTQLRTAQLRMVSPNSDLSLRRVEGLGPGLFDQLLGEADGEGGADGGEDFLPGRGFAAGDPLGFVDGAAQGHAEAGGLLGELLAFAGAEDGVAHAADHEEEDGAGADEDRRVLAHLQADVGQLVPAAIELGQGAVETGAQVLDVALDLAGRTRFGLAVALDQASRSFAHVTSSMSVRRVAPSGLVTRFFQPIRPATVPAARTTAATI